MGVYPMESSQEAPSRVREGKEDQDDIKRFLTFSDVEDEEETETKRKDSNFVTFARRMSCMVLGEKDPRQRKRSRRSPNPVLRSGGRRRSLKSLDSGHKLRLDLTTGCLIVKRKKSYFSNIWDLGVRCMKSLLGLPTTDPKAEAEREDVSTMQQLQDLCPSRHRPASVLSLSTKTGFTNNQIRRLYRGFKSECPSGILTEECFHKIYSSFFPGRELSYNDNLCSFTHYLYSLMDNKSQGFITFEEFVINLSIMVNGSDEQKYNWIFDLYDLNGDGFISKDEMEDVVHSIFYLVDPRVQDEYRNYSVQTKVSSIFREIDPDHVGLISRECWLSYCSASSKMISTVRNLNNGIV